MCVDEIDGAVAAQGQACQKRASGLGARQVRPVRESDLPRPWRAWGHPWTTGIVLAGSLAFLGGSVAGDTRNSLISLGCIVLSAPLFYLFRAPTGATSPPPPPE